ncbi:hypothetical protein ABMA27_014809 [Loxostege sticticalis]|uniref:Uncharacterized protein n=1 Tax=Loxostege sticticalis TaxID=481309 RepID=A0ABR3IAA5_LOXSC
MAILDFKRNLVYLHFSFNNVNYLFLSAGKSTSGINEEIIWISISMAIAIAVLIAIALCYILKEKCSKRQAYREQS